MPLAISKDNFGGSLGAKIFQKSFKIKLNPWSPYVHNFLQNTPIL